MIHMMYRFHDFLHICSLDHPNHTKPPKPAMASFSQSESESVKSWASVPCSGEKWLNPSTVDLICWYCSGHPFSLGEDLLKLLWFGRGGITTFISGPMVLLGGKLSYSTRTCEPWLSTTLASIFGWCSFSFGNRWTLQQGTFTLSSCWCICSGFTLVPSFSKRQETDVCS